MELKATPSKQHPYCRLAAFQIAKTPILQGPHFSPSGTFFEGGAPIKFQLNAFRIPIFFDGIPRNPTLFSSES